MDELIGPWEAWKAEATKRGFNTRQAFHTDSGYSEAVDPKTKQQVGLFNHGKKLGYFASAQTVAPEQG